jgi:hypothetical protein
MIAKITKRIKCTPYLIRSNRFKILNLLKKKQLMKYVECSTFKEPNLTSVKLALNVQVKNLKELKMMYSLNGYIIKCSCKEDGK